MTRKLINNFLYGETSQSMAGRLDTEAYSQGCSRLENMVCLKEGGIRRRSPLKALLDTNFMSAKWLIPFTINSEKSFVIILSNEGMCFAKWNKVDSVEQLTLIKDPSDNTQNLFISYSNAIKEQFTSDGETDNNLYINSITQETISIIKDDEFKDLRYASYYNSLYIVHRNHPMMRIDYDTNKDSFILTLPRIVVNQDIDYKLKQSDLDIGYKISDTLGFETFRNQELNTPQADNGKKHYPSVISIIGERMWLANTESNPDTIWVSRPFGTSQVLSKSDNHSIQDFTQFEIMEEDIQELKDTVEFPKTDKIDDNGYPVLQYDGNLNPLYRLPKGQFDVVITKFSETRTSGGTTTTSPTVYGFVVDGQLIAIKTADTDSNGYPVFINMSGEKLYNKIMEWDTGNKDSDGNPITVKYVYGIYLDSDYSSCFVKAKFGRSNKPLTDSDTTSYTDVEIKGNQLFSIYCVPLYSAYKERSLTISEPTSYWFSKKKVNLTYSNWSWESRYVYTNGDRYQAPSEYEGLVIYLPAYNDRQVGNLTIQKNPTQYTTIDWVKTIQQVEGLIEEPKSQIIPDKQVWTVGETYTVYTNVVKHGLYNVTEYTNTFQGNWVKGDTKWRANASKTGYPMYDSIAQRDSIETTPYNNRIVWVLEDDGWLRDLYRKYTFNGKFNVTSTVQKGTIEYANLPSNETQPTGAAACKNATYKTYDIVSVNTETWSATKTINTYSSSATITSVLSSNPFVGISADDTAYTNGSFTYGGASFVPTANVPIYLKINGNVYNFEQSGAVIGTFTKEEKNITNGTATIWTANASTFSIALTNGLYETLTPVYREGTIYGYVNSEQEDYIEGNAYEDTDLSNSSALVKYSKSLTKTSTSTTGIEVQVSSGRSDSVKWIGCQDYVIVGTSNAEWKIPTNITALEVSANKYANYGSDIGLFANINTDSIFLQKNNRARILYTDYYGMHNLDATYTNNEILQGKIIGIVAKQVPEPMVFFLKEDGTVASLCYDRDYKVQGWARLSFKEHNIKSLATVENDKTETLICLCNQEICGSNYSYICQFNEDFENNESHIFKDCSYSFTVSNDTEPDKDKQYYIYSNNTYRKAVYSDFTYTYSATTDTTPSNNRSYLVEHNDELVKVRYKSSSAKFYYEDGTEATGYTFPTDFNDYEQSFKDNVTYYEVALTNYTDEYTSLMTTNAYDAQTQDGSITLGLPKKVDKIIFRALDTGKICTYTSVKNKNTSIYEVSKDKSGVGDFTININGGTMRDLMVTVESVGGDPMTLLALAYDVRLNNGN